MREIKFRAWNKVQDRMFFVQGLDFTFDPPALLSLVHGLPNIKVVDYWLYDEDFELMQNTGMKDKNGKEIYEGDIVEGNPLGWVGTLKGEVVWMNDGWFVDCGDERDNEKRLWSDFFGKTEVIGNVWENSNLLEG